MLARVRAILVEVLSIDPAIVQPAARVLVELGAESIDLLDLRFRLEKAFGIRITDQELAAAFGRTAAADGRDAFTVGALCEYLQTRVAANA
jgi:acyl carrier protein